MFNCNIWSSLILSLKKEKLVLTIVEIFTSDSEDSTEYVLFTEITLPNLDLFLCGLENVGVGGDVEIGDSTVEVFIKLERSPALLDLFVGDCL